MDRFTRAKKAAEATTAACYISLSPEEGRRRFLFAKSTCNFRMFSRRRRRPSFPLFPFFLSFVCLLHKRFNGPTTALQSPRKNKVRGSEAALYFSCVTINMKGKYTTFFATVYFHPLANAFYFMREMAIRDMLESSEKLRMRNK